MRRWSVASVLTGVMILSLLLPGTALASTPPPPPATPVRCGYCGGPPPAPTPVPTLAPTQVVPMPQPHAVTVELSPTKVKRGEETRIAVTAATDDKVMMTFKYSRGKALIYRTKVGKTGKVLKRWKVSKTAPIGKASVKIEIDGDGKPYTATVSFTVTK